MAGAEDEDEATILICAPYRHYMEVSAYPTSVIRRASCGHLVWVAEAGQGMWEEAYAICEDCYNASEFPPDAEHHAAPGALEEVERLAGKAGVDAAHAKLARLRSGFKDA